MTIKNIPVGYKDSPLGIIPMEWEVKRLGEIGTFYGGGTPSKSIDEYWHGDIPWISSADLIENDIYWCNINRFITLEAIRNSSTQIIPQNSILIVTRVGVGKVAVAPCDLCVSQDYICLQNSGMNTIFLAYEIMQRMKNIVSQIQGTSIKGISINEVKKIQLPLPPLAEQEKIAEILSTWDKAIEKQIQLIQKLELRKKGLMQQLLTAKRRLPGFSDPWKEVRLGDIAELYQPQTIQSEDLSQTGYPVYGANGFIGYYNSYNHEYPQVVITCRGSSCGTVNFTPEKCWITGNAMVLNVDNNRDVNKSFFYYLISNSSFVNLISGSGQPQIVRQPLLKFELHIPPLKEQTSIAEVFTAADREIELAQQKLELLCQQKRGLMQQLLTGKKRVKY